MCILYWFCFSQESWLIHTPYPFGIYYDVWWYGSNFICYPVVSTPFIKMSIIFQSFEKSPLSYTKLWYVLKSISRHFILFHWHVYSCNNNIFLNFRSIMMFSFLVGLFALSPIFFSLLPPNIFILWKKFQMFREVLRILQLTPIYHWSYSKMFF